MAKEALTLAEVSKHNTKDDCWLVIAGKVCSRHAHLLLFLSDLVLLWWWRSIGLYEPADLAGAMGSPPSVPPLADRPHFGSPF
jgi:hypothetical protein